MKHFNFIMLFFALLSFKNSISQENLYCDLDALKQGKFEVYENGEKAGVFFRINGHQVEKSEVKDGFIISEFTIKNCKFFIQKKEIHKEIDTITMLAEYDKTGINEYSFLAKPAFLKIDYTYTGKIKKISNNITDEKILNIFKEVED